MWVGLILIGLYTDNIELNISSVAVDTGAASQELTTAAEYQRRAGKRAACLMLILAVVVAIVLLAVSLFYSHILLKILSFALTGPFVMMYIGRERVILASNVLPIVLHFGGSLETYHYELVILLTSSTTRTSCLGGICKNSLAFYY